MTRHSVGGPILDVISSLDWLDRPAERLTATVRDRVPAGRAKALLSGSWLGHPVHPMLVVVPIGSWTGVTALDLVRGRDSARSTELLIGLGAAAAVPAVVTGLHDWAESARPGSHARRVGLVHGATNGSALALHVASLVQRRRGCRTAGVRLARAGFCLLFIGDWLGGHLAFAEGVGVNHAAFDDAPAGWTRVLDAGRLADRQPLKAGADDLDLVIVRRDGAIYALADRCAHCGGSLSRGRLVEQSIQCPFSDTRFRLIDGAIERGPSAYPQRAYEAREHEGGVEVRRPGPSSSQDGKRNPAAGRRRG